MSCWFSFWYIFEKYKLACSTKNKGIKVEEKNEENVGKW